MSRLGTPFDNTKIELRKWFMAIWLVTSHKKESHLYNYQKILVLRKKQLGSCWNVSVSVFSSENNNSLVVEVDET